MITMIKLDEEDLEIEIKCTISLLVPLGTKQFLIWGEFREA
jgi:hypothetical protein